MIMLKWIAAICAVGYLGFAALMYVAQRALMYLPDSTRTAPAAAGFPQAEEVVLDTADGEKVIAWHLPPRGEKPVILYFHGNGGALRDRVPRFQKIAAAGVGLIALSYRGYGGSTGTPTEAGLIADARAAYAFAAARYPPQRLALWGESLGTGVAIALATEKPVARMILDAPFTAAVDIAAAHYRLLPVRLLMKDQFRSDERVARVKMPVLIMHGDADTVVPIAYGERLFAMIPGDKRFARFPGAGHVDLDSYGGAETALKFLAEPLD
jgi:pimeloyl-ACP methyl ester carboxylesterase